MNAPSQQPFFRGELKHQAIYETSKTKTEFNISEPIQYHNVVADKWVTAGRQVKRLLEIDDEPVSKRVATDKDSLPTFLQNNPFYTSNYNENMEIIPGPNDIDESNVFKRNTDSLDPEHMNRCIYIGILIPKNAFINMQGEEDNMLKLIGRESNTAIWCRSLEDKVSLEPLFPAETSPYVIAGRRKNVEHAFNWIKNWLSSYTKKVYSSQRESDIIL